MNLGVETCFRVPQSDSPLPFQHSLMNLGVETCAQKRRNHVGFLFQHSLMNLGVETPFFVAGQPSEVYRFSIL